MCLHTERQHDIPNETYCTVIKRHKKRERTHAADLGDLFIVLIKWLAVFPVEESGDAHNFFLLVDNGQRQDVLNEEA